jgi:hypothetical protein
MRLVLHELQLAKRQRRLPGHEEQTSAAAGICQDGAVETVDVTEGRLGYQMPL